MMSRKEIEDYEDKTLASYAMRSRLSRGRLHKEEDHPYRSQYQRDRDRIIHCAAFRRLEYKTQVFVNHEGDYYRTRLTHTLEVSQIARTIAKSLKLNEDLVEAISLAHDLGHTPFGHSGEEALSELMKDYGGFDHNSHGLRVVDVLEERYPGFKGLNLTWEVREGIACHSTPYDKSKGKILDSFTDSPLLETQVVDIADEIAYDNHDLDDGLTSNLINGEDLMKISIWKELYTQLIKKYHNLSPDVVKYQMIRELIDTQVTDLIKESENKIKSLNLSSVDDVHKIPEKIICFSKEIQERRRELRQFLGNNLYHHNRVIRMSIKAKRFLRDLFQAYLTNPEQLPSQAFENSNTKDVHRVICDYIAGMTDRYALNEHKKLFDPYEKV